ncbi:putative nuclease HARBI1 [Bagarius yarrelli]|uniref:Putative nuclease HARBI1 n=1 Tax=Bagarius yarrelli TaxID=175774 RepID=A0A556UZN6_BAGYA|nr:putative nuclease HARBI1 [Bagarius yarrelli]
MDLRIRRRDLRLRLQWDSPSSSAVDGSREVVVAASAGRLIMDMMQTEWEPLSDREMEQRLDRAVEDILEAELISSMEGCGESEGRSQSGFPQFSQQNETISHTENSHMSNPVASFRRQVEGELTSGEQHVTEIEENPRVQGRACLSLSHTVSLSLTLLSSRLSYRSLSSRFHLEKGNLHRIFFSFCHRVNALQSQIIRWPTGEEASALLLHFSSRLGQDEKLQQKDLPKVLGVLGHTRIPIRLRPAKHDCESGAPPAKRLRKRYHPDSWVNLELVCDAEGRFIHCSVSPASHRKQGETLMQRLAQNPSLLPPGICLLAGAGYPLTPHILTPFRHTQNLQENLYNRVLETHLRRLEQATADLKERFRRLHCLDMGRTERAGAAVLTCCILHTALLSAGYTTTGQIENHTEVEEEEEEEGLREEAGVRLRETVCNLLYEALKTGNRKEDGEHGHCEET